MPDRKIYHIEMDGTARRCPANRKGGLNNDPMQCLSMACKRCEFYIGVDLPTYTLKCSNPDLDESQMSREDVLLRAAFFILKQCHDSTYVQNVLELTEWFDETYCDGSCLMDDIGTLLIEKGLVDDYEDS